MTDNHRNLCPLPAETDWKARWIWVLGSVGYAFRNSYAFFRKRFHAAGQLSIDVAADTRCDLLLGGKRIDRVTAPSMPAHKTFDTAPTGPDWARGTVLTPLGKLSVSWKMDGERLSVGVQPPNAMSVSLRDGPKPRTQRTVAIGCAQASPSGDASYDAHGFSLQAIRRASSSDRELPPSGSRSL